MVIISCGEKLLEKPENLIPKSEMIKILKDLTIINAAKNTNIIVFFEKLLPPNNLLVSAKTYLEITKDQYINLDIGYKINEEITDVVVADKKFFKMTAELNEAGMKQIFLCRKHEDFIIGIIITAGIDNQTEIDNLINSIVE